jgi:hypothetical protein
MMTMTPAPFRRYLSRATRAVYLVDFSCFEPPEDWKVSHSELMEMMRRQRCFTQDSLDFMDRILGQSGTGASGVILT